MKYEFSMQVSLKEVSELRNSIGWNGMEQMKKMNFEKITACLDMYGCTNRCKHCWLGITPNGNLSIDDLKFVAE